MAPKKEPSKYDGIDSKSQAWAEIMKEVGAPVDIEDPKQLEKLKEFAKRKNWTSVAYSPNFKRGGNK